MSEVLAVIENQDWLEPAEDGLQKVLSDAFEKIDHGTKTVEDLLHGKWMGHPLHPAITDIPVGAWSTALIFDLTGADRAAGTAIAVGLVGAVAAAATGLTDWKDTHGKDRRVGIVHGLLNTVSAGLYIGSLIARKNGNRKSGRKLSYAGFSLMLASAWLGGEMVYKYRTGVDRSTEVQPPEDWKPVIRESDLVEGKPVKVDAGGFPVFLLKRGYRVFAIGNTCSHRGGPLDEGKLDGDCITCPWHGSTFRVDDGAVVNGPATQPQPRFNVRLRDGQIEVKAAD